MKNAVVWIVAVVVTLASAVYQKKTGPNHAVKGKATIGQQEIKFKFNRTHAGAGDQLVTVTVHDTTIQGFLFYKRYPTNDEWTKIAMTREGEKLAAYIPHQPPAGKVEYFVELASGASIEPLPAKGPIITRFRGDVPPYILIPHIFFMFFGMLLSTRTGLEALKKQANLSRLVVVTTAFLFIGGMILGPLVQKFAFDAYWTGFPFGTDLTDNKTLVAMIGWFIALWAIWRKRNQRLLAGVAAVITLLIFLIPHSMAGSELDYSTLEQQAGPADSVQVR